VHAQRVGHARMSGCQADCLLPSVRIVPDKDPAIYICQPARAKHVVQVVLELPVVQMAMRVHHRRQCRARSLSGVIHPAIVLPESANGDTLGKISRKVRIDPSFDSDMERQCLRGDKVN
jgi:hypothetical protein